MKKEEHTSSCVGKEKNDSADERRHLIGAILGPLVAIWWITEPVPIAVTSLLGPMLCVVFGVASVEEAFDNFANPMISLFMGGFLLAKGMMVNGRGHGIFVRLHDASVDSSQRYCLCLGLCAYYQNVQIRSHHRHLGNLLDYYTPCDVARQGNYGRIGSAHPARVGT